MRWPFAAGSVQPSNRLPSGLAASIGRLAPAGASLGDSIRYRIVAVDSATVIEIGDLVYMDGTLKPDNYYSYGQAVDVLQVDPYYQRRLSDSYWKYTARIPLYEKATYIYAVSKATTTATVAMARRPPPEPLRPEPRRRWTIR